jgi:polar amino acid transport system permease protein
LSPYIAGVLALGVNTGAFVSETIRGGLQAVPQRQIQAGQALGLSYWRILWRIQLPQALRASLPGVVGEAVAVIKNTSLLSTITVVEITLHAQIGSAATFRPFDFFIASAFCYLVLTSVVMMIGRILERKINIHNPVNIGV